MTTELSMTGIQLAISTAGSQAKLAALLGCSQQAIGSWLRQGYVPTERVVEIEQATGVHRQHLINPRLVSLVLPATI